ncbi:MAG TPA: hypothetical protein VES20_00985, partial [Bryobacteraceae bacterium]|nr:hypothetical protein [Bryobacteraceae bacterium]
EIWETGTGGESWNISQVDSRPLPFENPRRPGTYRITSSSQARVHRVERNAGGKWSVVAELSLVAGECKPPEEAAPAQPD